MLLEKLSEYILELSLLIFELQNNSASMVASACILSARKIMNVNPLWSRELEEMTNYSYKSLLKCANIILSNYNNLKLGSIVLSVEKSFRPQIIKYEHTPLEDLDDIKKEICVASSVAISSFDKMTLIENLKVHKRIPSIKPSFSPADDECYSSVHFSEPSNVICLAESTLSKHYYKNLNKSTNFSKAKSSLQFKRRIDISNDTKERSQSDRYNQPTPKYKLNDSKKSLTIQKYKRGIFPSTNKSFDANKSIGSNSKMILPKIRNNNTKLYKIKSITNESPQIINSLSKTKEYRCSTSLNGALFSTQNRFEQKQYSKLRNQRLNEDNECSSLSIVNIAVMPKQSSNSKMLFNNPTEVSLSKENNQYLSSQESLGIQSKSPHGPFTCFSNKNMYNQMAKSRQQTSNSSLSLKCAKDQISTTRGSKPKTHFIKVDLNDESMSPKQIMKTRNNHNSSSTEIEEDSDTMESIDNINYANFDEALPPKLVINKTKIMRSLCQQKGKFKSNLSQSTFISAGLSKSGIDRSK